MNEKKCWVCEGLRPEFLGKRCEVHDICDACKAKRADLKSPPWGTRTGFICQECETARQKERIAEFQKTEHQDSEFWNNDKVKCPHCGHEYHPDDLYESCDDVQCPECDSYMTVEIEWTASYTTSKSEDP